MVNTGKWLSYLKTQVKAFPYIAHSPFSSCIHRESCSWRGTSTVLQLALAVVEAYALGYDATTKRAVLQSVAADLTTAYMTTGQEDYLGPSLHADHTL